MDQQPDPRGAGLIEPRHGLRRSILPHLYPGGLIMAAYLLLAGPTMAVGLPAMMAMMLAIALVAIPVELGELLRSAAAGPGRWRLAGALSFRAQLPWWQYVVITFAFLVLAAVVSGAAAVVDTAVAGSLLEGLPDWFLLNEPASYSGYARETLITTLIVNLALNGVLAPVVEESYFRGFLLPRLAWLGRWAPLVNAGLVTVYHFWQPYVWMSILAIMVPLSYLVWWKRSV